MRGRALALGACVFVGLFAVAAVAAPPSDPSMSVTPSSQDFGTLCVGATSTKSFSINNAGGSDTLHVQSIKRGSDSGSERFTPQEPPAPASIAGGASAKFDVTFTAPAHGEVDTTYTVTGDDPSDPTDTVSVKGRGVDRRIASDRTSVSFGEQRVGTRSPNQTLEILNSGADVLHVSSARRIGANARDFRTSMPSSFDVPSNTSIAFTVSFQPTGSGLRNASLEIRSDACAKSKLLISLVGSGAVSKVLVDPNPIDAGSSPVDKQGAPVAVTVSNTGGAPLKITAVQVLGADAEDFVLEDLPTMPATIPVAESFIFHVRMTPSAEGARVATISILSDDPSAPTFSVDLRGTGGKASPSPTPSASASASPSASPKATTSTKPQAFAAASNDSLAIVLVIVAVLLAFVGLIVIRRFIAIPDDDE